MNQTSSDELGRVAENSAMLQLQAEELLEQAQSILTGYGENRKSDDIGVTERHGSSPTGTFRLVTKPASSSPLQNGMGRQASEQRSPQNLRSLLMSAPQTAEGLAELQVRSEMLRRAGERLINEANELRREIHAALEQRGCEGRSTTSTGTETQTLDCGGELPSEVPPFHLARGATVFDTSEQKQQTK